MAPKVSTSVGATPIVAMLIAAQISNMKSPSSSAASVRSQNPTRLIVGEAL
jgi:hypothetical protein